MASGSSNAAIGSCHLPAARMVIATSPLAIADLASVGVATRRTPKTRRPRSPDSCSFAVANARTGTVLLPWVRWRHWPEFELMGLGPLLGGSPGIEEAGIGGA